MGGYVTAVYRSLHTLFNWDNDNRFVCTYIHTLHVPVHNHSNIVFIYSVCWIFFTVCLLLLLTRFVLFYLFFLLTVLSIKMISLIDLINNIISILSKII